MDRTIEQVRSLLQKADDALSRHASPSRTPRERDEDFDQALRAHRQAVLMLETLSDARVPVDAALVESIAPLQVEAADLEIILSEIRFDEHDRTERLPRVRHG